jgi:transglutaminase-like putative cysteine protease
LILSIQTHLSYSTPQPCDVLLQIEAASDATQLCEAAKLEFTPPAPHRQISGEENYGTRQWVQAGTRFECTYEARVTITRPPVNFQTLQESPVAQTPSDVTKFLMPSRYCHPEAFFDVVPSQFGGLSGGTRIAAMSDWIMQTFTYDASASTAATTAIDSYDKRAGVCRDYAHVLIAMARASGIPARFVSAYAPDVQPQDFHAVLEVYLEDAWHLIDPTGMSLAPEIARIGVGRDAADVSFMTSYGLMVLKEQTVSVTRCT